MKNKLGNDMVNAGMEIPFHSEIKAGYDKAKKAYIHSERCKVKRAKRHQKFDKVRILYWNLMFLLAGITIVSVGRILYDVVRIIKM